MQIVLNKDIPVYKMVFIGEVDFFRESPYLELLKNIDSEKELRIELENRTLSEAAIKNVLQKLRELKILNDGYIEKSRNGFPIKEYGKFALEVFENNAKRPFKNRNGKIERESAFHKEIPNLQESPNFIRMVSNDTNPKFRVEIIENNKAVISSAGSAQLQIQYLYNWEYFLDEKKYEMEIISFEQIFGSDWDCDSDSIKISFQQIEYSSTKDSFEFSYQDEVKIQDYGQFNANFQNIPVIPKSAEDAKEWALSLLKDEIELQNRYISKEELRQIWNNLLDRKSKLKKFDLRFDFEKILQKFGKDSKYYWLLKASSDLFPFDNILSPHNRVLIENGEFANKFNFEIKDITIFDRYANTMRHFRRLDKILEVLNNPSIKIFTTQDYDQSEREEILQYISNRNIDRRLKSPNELSHSIYWIFNNQYFYRVSESLDGIDNTSFDLYYPEDIQKIDSIVLELARERV